MSLYTIQDILDLADYACENIIQAARDVNLVQTEEFPAEIFFGEKKIGEITEFDILREKLDLGHLQISKNWLSQVDHKKRKKVREKLNNGLQSIAWFTGIGCPYLTYPECCQAIDDALRLINIDCRKMDGILLDPGLLTEEIFKAPKPIIKILLEVQSSVRNFASVKNKEDEVIETWFKTDYCRAIGWDECREVSPYINSDNTSSTKVAQLN